MKKFILALLACGLVVSAKADFSIQLDAGRLTQSTSIPLPLNSLLIFVAAGPDGVFSTNLTPGQYTGGDDILLAMAPSGNGAAAFNTNGGPEETLNTLVVSAQGLSATSQEIAVLWFPQITFSQFKAGAVPVAGNTFGLYNPSFYGNPTDNPDGGSVWQASTSTSGLINLNFFTTNSNGGGSQLPSEGFSQFTVIPEPSSLALLGIGLAGAGVVVSRRRRA